MATFVGASGMTWKEVKRKLARKAAERDDFVGWLWVEEHKLDPSAYWEKETPLQDTYWVEAGIRLAIARLPYGHEYLRTIERRMAIPVHPELEISD